MASRRRVLQIAFALGLCWVLLTGTTNCRKESKSIWEGSVVAVNPPTSANPGATLRFDLTGTTLGGAASDCIVGVNATWERLEGAPQVFTVPARAGCKKLSGYTIDVVVPKEETTFFGKQPYAGGKLKLLVYTAYQEVGSTQTRYAAIGEFPVQTPAQAAPAPAPPVADLFARYSPMPAADYAPTVPPNGDPIAPDEVARSFAAVDARMSTDPAGGALVYAWDLDGDEVYGDPPAGGTGVTDLPAGVAIVPASRRQVQGTGSTEVAVGVRVTNAAGASATKRITVPVQNQGYYPISRKIIGLDAATATAGGMVTLMFDASGTEMVCIDGNGASPLSAVGTPFDINTTNTAPGKSFPLIALGPGTHRVTVALIIGLQSLSSCTTPSAADVRYTWSDVYTSVAARKAAKPYQATGRFTIAGTTQLAGSFTRLGVYEKLVARGRYTLSTPVRGGGSARPAPLALFRRGDVVTSSPALHVFGTGPGKPEVLLGSSTMLLRGTGGVLACVRADSGVDATRYTMLGGTGAARTLRFQALGGATAVAGTGGRTTVVASTGAARGLPKACRSLVRRLP